MLPGLLFLEATTIYLQEPGKEVPAVQKTGTEAVRKLSKKKIEINKINK